MIRSRAILVVSVSMVTAGACQRPPVSTSDGAGGRGGSGNVGHAGNVGTTGSGGRGQACAIFQVQAVNKLPLTS